MSFRIVSSPKWAANRKAVLLMALAATIVNAAVQDITVGGPPCKMDPDFSYAAKPGDVVNESIGVGGASGQVEWSFAASEGQCTVAASGATATCAGNLTITLPTSTTGTVDQSLKATLTGSPTSADVGKSGAVTINVTDVAGHCATRKYTLRVTSDGGGWGDPHMTTVDGVKYDFQSAGEFRALTEDKFEVQTRQRPVSTGSVPGASEYTGLGVCVSTYSAMATRIGSNRITLQPNLSGQPDPSGLQLRVNGQLVTLTDSGIDLRAGGSPATSAALEGRIVKAAGGAFEFDDVRGTQLVATPAYWDAQQTWYLNLSVYQTSATQGIWGRLASGSWLPALPDGTSLGGKPNAADARYNALYGKFANAWRVTDATSLFDYAPGTNTATFTVPNWPQFNARACVIKGQTAVVPTTTEVATRACSGVTDPIRKANCIFDVTVTGNTGIAQTYVTMQGFRPHGTGWQPVLAGGGTTSPLPTSSSWPWWWWIVLLILVLIIVVVVWIAKK